MGEGMNELQDNVLEDESLLNLSERNQGENAKIIGMNKANPLRKMLAKWDGDKKFSKALEAMGEKQILHSSHINITPVRHAHCGMHTAV